MSKYYQPKNGPDGVGYATREQIELLRDETGQDFPYNSILIGREKKPYAVIYYHKGNRWVAYTLRPLTHDTLNLLTRLLSNPKGLRDFIKAKAAPQKGQDNESD